jgi:hypothetical protein
MQKPIIKFDSTDRVLVGRKFELKVFYGYLKISEVFDTEWLINWLDFQIAKDERGDPTCAGFDAWEGCFIQYKKVNLMLG